MKLSVVIVNYNVRLYAEQCIRSVLRASGGMDAEVWLVDNASTDGSVDYLRPLFPEVHFIANKDNHGFSYANNQAIRQSSGEYVLLLNPDTIVGEDVLRGCVDFLDSHPYVGATGVRMLNADGSFALESRRGIPTPFTSFCKMSGLCSLFPRNRVLGRYYMQYLDPDVEAPIEIISGAFNMLRRKALDQIGLLDETFFMYGEDIDLSYRMLEAGWQNYYLPLNILHYKGESTVKSSYRYVHNFYNAMLIFFNKHYGKRYKLLGLLVRSAVVLRAMADLYGNMLSRLACPHRATVLRYMRRDLRTTSISAVLRELQMQDDGGRCFLETVSHDGQWLIRHFDLVRVGDNGVAPATEDGHGTA